MASSEAKRSSDGRLRTLTLTTLFPNAAQPGLGIFIEHRLRHILATGRVESRVVAPIPWFPSSHARFGRYAKFARVPRVEEWKEFRVLHPRYAVLPKIGMTITPAALGLSLLQPLRRLVRDGGDFDIIDAYYFYPDGVAAAWLGAVLAKPVVIHGLGTDINLIPDFAMPRRMIQWAAHRAAGISTVCQALKDRLCSYGVAPEKVRVILHGVDLDLFRPPADRDADRRALGMTGPTLISIGYLIERKGHHIAIAALQQLPDCRLFIAGEGEMEAELKALALRLGVSDRVRFLGRVDQRVLRQYLGAADALVLASSREGIANVLLEAMACGTPVVATDVWGSAEVITDPVAGERADRTADAVAAGLQSVLARKVSRAETRRFVEAYTWQRTAADHVALLDDVIGAR